MSDKTKDTDRQKMDSLITEIRKVENGLMLSLLAFWAWGYTNFQGTPNVIGGAVLCSLIIQMAGLKLFGLRKAYYKLKANSSDDTPPPNDISYLESLNLLFNFANQGDKHILPDIVVIFYKVAMLVNWAIAIVILFIK